MSDVKSEPVAPIPTLGELALLFLRLGCTAFGGPAAHIAMMEDEVVTRRRWLSREKFLDLLGATNLIPGPNSTEMAIHIGLLAGWSGLVLAGVCFILPAAILTTLCAWAYVTYGKLPEVAGVLYGVKPVIIAVVVQALWKLAGDSLKSRLLHGVALGAGVLNVCGVHELLVLALAGIVVALLQSAPRPQPTPPPPAPPAPALLLWASAPVGGAAAATPVVGLWPLFLIFVKIGSVLFGSGYVLLAFLRAELVERNHWLSNEQLIDAVAVGQFTPGPVFTTATFIGYILAGLPGAAVATVGIFLPAFFFVAISGPLVPRIRQSRIAGAFLDGVIVASLALMAVVTVELLRAALVDVITIVLALASAVVLVRYRISSMWLVLGGAAVGMLAASLGGLEWQRLFP